MKILDFIFKFPEITEKNDKYNLYLGILSGLNAKETQNIINHCMDQGILKRKAMQNKVVYSAANWTREENNQIFKEIYNSINTFASYFKKESASMILITLFPHVSRANQNKLVIDFSQSRYKNNRKRVYKYFYKNWSPNCKIIIEKAWENFQDEESIGLIIAKMPKEFLIKNLDELLAYFNDDDLTYDYFRRLLRNKLYSRLFDEIPSIIEGLKKKDPISYIFIKKVRKEKLDTKWAIEIYKKFSRSRFLARWYSEMNLWPEILKEKPDFLSEIK